MASPWISAQRPPAAERPWMGMALLIAIPLLSLILIRMLWSGSSLWFLTVGLILLGAAAIIFLARRPQELEYGRTLAQETSRLPLALAGMGLVFLAMLLLPNFAGGGSDGTTPIDQTGQQSTTTDTLSDVADTSQQPVTTSQEPPTTSQDTTSQEPQTASDADTLPAGSQTYIVADGDTLWDIAVAYSTTVEAIVAANGLENAADIQIGQELIIPPSSGESVPADTTDDSGATDDSTAGDGLTDDAADVEDQLAP